MDRLIAYGVLAFALYKIFIDDKSKESVMSKPKEQGSTTESKLNMTGFPIERVKRDEGVNGIYFDGNVNFFN